MPLETTEAMTKVREAIRSAIDGGAVDPGDVAEKADASLTDEIRLEAWPLLLRHVARELIRERRSVSPTDIPQQRQPEPASATSRGKAPEPVTVGGKKFASARMAARVSWWQKQLQGSEAVNGTWKALPDLTIEDLAWLSQDRRKKAGELTTVADRYERFAAEMQSRGLTTLGQVDEATALKVWGDAA